MVYNSIFPSFQNRPYSLYALSSQSVCIVLTICMHCAHYLQILFPKALYTIHREKDKLPMHHYFKLAFSGGVLSKEITVSHIESKRPHRIII